LTDGRVIPRFWPTSGRWFVRGCTQVRIPRCVSCRTEGAAVRVAAIVVSTALTLIGVALVARAAAAIVAVVRRGQPAVGRTDHPAERWRTLVRETFGHSRMLQWRLVGI